ncbi:MAG: alpha/beta hydrolase [Planctomycetota bacterium]
MTEEGREQVLAEDDPQPSLWQRVRRVLLRWALILTGLYFVLAVFLYLFQSKLVFIPHRQLEGNPGGCGMPFEDLMLEAPDGLRIHAWHVPAHAESRGAVLFCHGNAGNISHRLESIRVFRNLGLDTLIFDYRGYGRSDGSPSEEGTYLDVEAAWRHLIEEKKVDPGRVVIFGRSLGGAVASHLAAARAPRALILESCFTSVPDMGAELYPWAPVRLLARIHYPTLEYVGRVGCPVLVIHSPDDEMIPYSHGRRIFRAAGEPKSFLKIRGSHNNGWFDSKSVYVDGLREFVLTHLPLKSDGADD